MPKDPKENISERDKSLIRKLHQTIRKVTCDLERLHQNTSISAIMELVNTLYDYMNGPNPHSNLIQETLERIALLLFPFAPHFAEEMWEILGHTGGLRLVDWPTFDQELARESVIEIVVQVNGKVRSRFSASPEITRDDMENKAFRDDKVQGHIQDKTVEKVIIVPQKLVNIVVSKT